MCFPDTTLKPILCLLAPCCVLLCAEALRIHPPLLMVMRYAKQHFSVTTSKGQTYTIPEVSSCIHATVVVSDRVQAQSYAFMRLACADESMQGQARICCMHLGCHAVPQVTLCRSFFEDPLGTRCPK